MPHQSHVWESRKALPLSPSLPSSTATFPRARSTVAVTAPRRHRSQGCLMSLSARCPSTGRSSSVSQLYRLLGERSSTRSPELKAKQVRPYHIPLPHARPSQGVALDEQPALGVGNAVAGGGRRWTGSRTVGDPLHRRGRERFGNRLGDGVGARMSNWPPLSLTNTASCLPSGETKCAILA
jgi:hypothetical protein